MSDRQLWLQEPCPTCAARSGLRCQTSRYRGKPLGVLHAARGWRQRSCPTCKAQPGELCKTPTGRRAAQPHTARLHPGRRELFAEPGVWEELERWEAATALVRFSGGGSSQGSVAAVTLEDAEGRTLARWQSGEGELPEALAAPIWGRYALFRGHPRVSGLLMWPSAWVAVPSRKVAGLRSAKDQQPCDPHRAACASREAPRARRTRTRDGRRRLLSPRSCCRVSAVRLAGAASWARLRRWPWT